MGTFARLDAFARGELVGLRKAGTARGAIRKMEKKKDGKVCKTVHQRKGKPKGKNDGNT